MYLGRGKLNDFKVSYRYPISTLNTLASSLILQIEVVTFDNGKLESQQWLINFLVSELKYKTRILVEVCLTLKLMLFLHIFIHLCIYSFSGFVGWAATMH